MKCGTQWFSAHYSITDIAQSGFAVFFMQSVSFLGFQRRLGKAKGQHNLYSLFGVPEVPSDNHIRSILDEVPSESAGGSDGKERYCTADECRRVDTQGKYGSEIWVRFTEKRYPFILA